MMDDLPHAGKKSRDKGTEETVGVGVLGFHLGKRHTAAVRDADDRTTRPTTADTLVAHEEREEKAGIAADSGAIEDTAHTTASGRAQEHKTKPSSLNRFPPQNEETLSRKISQTPVNLNLETDYPVHLYDDDYDSDNADNEIQEVPRGREGLVGMSTNRLPSGSSLVSLGIGRMAEIPRRLSSTPPPPISPSSNIPLPHSPTSQLGSRSRPRTAPNHTAPSAFTATTTISPSPLASAPVSRPGTGDSAGPIRHHRLDSIRGTTIPHKHVQGHRTPPTTRDSSPSRSVRFVDYVDGESGHVGPFGPVAGSSGNDDEGRVVTVVDIPPPTPSRSNSFNRHSRNGRTLVGGGLEGEEGSAVSPASGGSVPTTVASRPPTR
jgi:hypothetical protein